MPNDPLPQIHATDFLANGCMIGATHIGNRREALQMLDVAAKNGVRSWIQREELTAEGCSRAVKSVRDGKARYRWVLVREEASFANSAEEVNGVNGRHVNGVNGVNGHDH